MRSFLRTLQKHSFATACLFWTQARLREKLAWWMPLCDEWKCHQLGCVCVFKALAGFPASLCYRWNNTPEVLPPQCWQKRPTNSGLQGLVFSTQYSVMCRYKITIISHGFFSLLESEVQIVWSLIIWNGNECLNVFICVCVCRLTALKLDPSMLPPTPRWAAVREDSKPEGAVAEHYPLPSSLLHAPLRPLRFYWTGRAH